MPFRSTALILAIKIIGKRLEMLFYPMQSTLLKRITHIHELIVTVPLHRFFNIRKLLMSCSWKWFSWRIIYVILINWLHWLLRKFCLLPDPWLSVYGESTLSVIMLYIILLWLTFFISRVISYCLNKIQYSCMCPSLLSQYFSQSTKHDHQRWYLIVALLRRSGPHCINPSLRKDKIADQCRLTEVK